MFRWHNWFSKGGATARKRSFRKSSPPTMRVRPQLEMLEDRITPSVTVTTTLDPATPVAGQVSLREAINMVNAGQVADNTIILPAGTYQNMQGALNVTHSLILQGTGSGTTIIDGGGNRQVIDIDPEAAVNVQISGVTVRDGASGGFGGGIAVEDSQGQSSTLTVMNSIITANKGGGIFANNGNINVNNSQITDNKGGFFGGIGDDNDGSSNISVTDSLIADNTASLAGAGISIVNVGHGAVTITGSTLRDNSVTTNDFGGGGIFAQTTGDINIGNSTIEGNTSLNDGGGLEVLGFDGQTGGPANIVLSNDTIANNQSSQGNGGGIAIETASNVSLQNTTLNGNTATEAGGGVFLNPNVLTATLQGSTVSSNTAGTFGGGIEDQAQTLTATNSTFSNNLVSNGNGGGIDVEKGTTQTVNLTNVTLTGNQAKENTDFGFGGGINDSSAGSSVTLASCLLANNTAAEAGGGIEQTGGTLTIQTSQLTGNVAANNGGALDFDAGTALTISAGTFNNNQSGLSGGAVDDRAAGTGSSLTNDTFTGNSAVGDGGAVAILSGPLALVNDTINDNTAKGNGGGVGDDSLGKQSFQNCIIAGNTAPEGNGPDVFTTIVSTGSILTDLGGNFIGTLSGSFGFGAGTLTGNPLLGPLQNNGGIVAGAAGTQQVVQTEALLTGSSAIGKGVANSAPTTDERGFNRISPPDIGAFQFQNATLTVAVAPATPSVVVNGTETFTITVTNTSGNALPADNSTLSVVLSNGLTTTDPLTFTLAAIPAGQSQTFTVTTTATTLGTQSITATVNSVDANPNTTSGSATIHVVVNTPPISPPSVTTHSPIGALTLFGIGFGPSGIDLFEVDGQGEVFAQAFGFGGANGTPQFVAADAVFRNLALMNGAIIADVLGGSGQPFLMEVLNFSDPFVFQGLLNALFGSRGL